MSKGTDPPRNEQLESLPVVCDAGAGEVGRRRVARFTRPIRKDPAVMTLRELLTTILGPASDAICAELAGTYRNLRRLAAVHAADLRDHGLTARGVEKLNVLVEIAKRYGEEEFVPGAPLRGSYDVYAHFRERLAGETREHFYAVLLDNKHRKLKDVLVSIGSLTSSVVHPRDVYSLVIRNAAAAVIFVHNHPSGDATPSKEDLDLTRRLREVGDLVGIRVLDHVIIGQGRYVSLVDDGFW